MNDQNSFTTFNSSYVDPHKYHPASIQFWNRFAEMHIEGKSKYIKFMEPKLQEFEKELEQFTDPSEEAWVKSIQQELVREKAQLELIKENRKTYGEMTVKLREFENKRKTEEEELATMKAELKKLEKNTAKLQKAARDLRDKFASKVESCDLAAPAEEFHEKIKKIEKIRYKFEMTRGLAEKKKSVLKQKSEELIRKFSESESSRITFVLNTWRDAMGGIAINLKSYRKTMGVNKGGSRQGELVDVQPLVEFLKQNRMKEFHYSNFPIAITKHAPNTSVYDFNLKTSRQILMTNVPVATLIGVVDEEKTNDAESNVEPQTQDRDPENEPTQNEDSENEVEDYTPVEEISRNVPRVKKEIKVDDQLHIEDFSDEELEPAAEMWATVSRPLPVPKATQPVPVPKAARPLPVPAPTAARPLPLPTATRPLPVAEVTETRRIPDFTAPNLRAGNNEAEEPFYRYSAKIRQKFDKEVEGQMSVKKGDRVMIIGRPDNGYVLAKKKDRLGLKKKRGLIPVYSFDAPN